MFVFVVMRKADTVIFVNFMTLPLPPFRVQDEMTSQVSFSCLKLSHSRVQGERNSSFMWTQEYLSLTFIILNKCVIICANAMVSYHYVNIFSLLFNVVNAATNLSLKT